MRQNARTGERFNPVNGPGDMPLPTKVSGAADTNHRATPLLHPLRPGVGVTRRVVGVEYPSRA